jgi:transposase
MQMSQACERDKTRLTDPEWERILTKLRTINGIYTGNSYQCRHFVEAVLWVLRVGGPWRSLPRDRGNWNSVFKRFAGGSQRGVWGQLLEWMAKQADLQEVSIDSSSIRAHACAAGAAQSSADKEALGRSRGGFGSKIHAAADGLGLPIKFILTEGQAADSTQAIPLMDGLSPLACLADKGYDADELLAWLQEKGIKAVIPPKSNRKDQRDCDYWHYKERHAVECLFGKLKYFRRIAMRYEKKALHFMEMLSFAATLLWLR